MAKRNVITQTQLFAMDAGGVKVTTFDGSGIVEATITLPLENIDQVELGEHGWVLRQDGTHVDGTVETFPYEPTKHTGRTYGPGEWPLKDVKHPLGPPGPSNHQVTNSGGEDGAPGVVVFSAPTTGKLEDEQARGRVLRPTAHKCDMMCGCIDGETPPEVQNAVAAIAVDLLTNVVANGDGTFTTSGYPLPPQYAESERRAALEEEEIANDKRVSLTQAPVDHAKDEPELPPVGWSYGGGFEETEAAALADAETFLGDPYRPREPVDLDAVRVEITDHDGEADPRDGSAHLSQIKEPGLLLERIKAGLEAGEADGQTEDVHVFRTHGLTETEVAAFTQIPGAKWIKSTNVVLVPVKSMSAGMAELMQRGLSHRRFQARGPVTVKVTPPNIQDMPKSAIGDRLRAALRGETTSSTNPTPTHEHSTPEGFAQGVLDLVRNRGGDYGTPAQNHQLTADLMSAFLSRKARQTITITAEDVCMFNILQKISRLAYTSKDDSYADIAGYVENVAMLRPDQRAR
jgi:hypothetical protein